MSLASAALPGVLKAGAAVSASYTVPTTTLGARELHEAVTGVAKGDRYTFLGEYFAGQFRTRMNGHPFRVASPFGAHVDPVAMNRARLAILEERYGSMGHNALIAGLDAAVTKARSGSVLTWNLHNEAGQAVATASLKLHDGAAELCSAAALVGSKGSTVQHARLADFFSREGAYRVWALQSELRASQAYTDPTGQVQPESSPTQHINRFLAPYLLHSGVVYTDGQAHWVEAQLDSRFFVQPEGVDMVLFTPTVNPYDPNGVTQADIARVTYNNAFGATPDIHSMASSDSYLEPTVEDMMFSPPRVAVKISGTWQDKALARLIAEDSKRTDILEYAVMNHPQNIGLQLQLYRLGFVPVGVWPGGEFDVHGYPVVAHSYFHFQRPRDGFDFQLIPYELAAVHQNTPVAEMMGRIAADWRRRFRVR